MKKNEKNQKISQKILHSGLFQSKTAPFAHKSKALIAFICQPGSRLSQIRIPTCQITGRPHKPLG